MPAFPTNGGNSRKDVTNWRFLLLTCLLSLATITGVVLLFNPGGIVPRGLLPAPPKKKAGAKKGAAAAGAWVLG